MTTIEVVAPGTDYVPWQELKIQHKYEKKQPQNTIVNKKQLEKCNFHFPFFSAGQFQLRR